MVDREPQRWGVIGGGFLGMTLALRLAQRGHDVTLLERAEHLGGLASAWSLGDIVWDRHYHVTLLSDTYTRAILRELRIEEEMNWVQTRTGFFTNGRFHSMSSSLEFLRFPPLGLVSKARLALTIFLASRIRDWKRLEDIPVADWLRRWSGTKTFEKIWLPLLRSKLGESYRQTSAAFIWATIARMYAARRTGLKREMFGYVRGGYARILEVFHEHLVEEGVKVELGANVSNVSSTSSGRVNVTNGDGSSRTFDQVVLTVAAPVAARLCPDLSVEEHRLLEGIEYQGIVCASALLKKPLEGFYVTNITETWAPFTAIIEMSALVDREEFGGKSLVYFPKYMSSEDSGFQTSDDEWRERFVDGLTRMCPYLSTDDIEAFRVSRERYVYALSTLGYSRRLPPKHISIPGVHIVNSAHIVNGTLNVNETVKLAEESAVELLASDTCHPTQPLREGTHRS